MKLFVPIKKNSQRVPEKNFREFNGKPLWRHFIDRFSDFEIFIDTDSDLIIREIDKEKSKNNFKNVYSYKRNDFHIGDDVPVNLLIENFLEKYIENENEIITQAHTTSPFLLQKTLKDARNHLTNNYDSVVACDIISARIWRKENRNTGEEVYIPVNHNPRRLEKTQNLNKYFVENSAYYIFTKKSFFKGKNRIGESPYFEEVIYPENLDIDTEVDWNYCQDVLKKNENLF